MADYAARIRAARLYADLTQQQLADLLGVDVQTIKRREYPPGHPHRQDPKKGERVAIAAICGVPADFMENGLGGSARDEVNQRLAEVAATLEEQFGAQRVVLEEVARRVATLLEQQVSRQAALERSQAQVNDALRLFAARVPTREGEKRGKHPGAADEAQGNG